MEEVKDKHPINEDRVQVRTLMKEGQFLEVYVKCSIEECEHRDPKGIYKKVRSGQIKEFTGISSPYEEPESPEILIETDKMSVEGSVKKVLDYLVENKYINFLEDADEVLVSR